MEQPNIAVTYFLPDTKKPGPLCDGLRQSLFLIPRHPKENG